MVASEQLPSGAQQQRPVGALTFSPVVVFTQDLDLRYTWIHDPAASFRSERMSGVQDEDLLGLDDEALLGPDEARPLVAIKRQVLSSGEARRCEVQLTIRGLTKWYDLSVHPDRDAAGRIVGVLCTAVDITEQKHTEKVLRQRSERLSLLFEAATGLLATSDPMLFLEQLFARLAVLLDLDVYAHYAVSSDGRHLRLAACGGLTPRQRRQMSRLRVGEPPCGIVAETRRPLIVADVQSSEGPGAEAIRSVGLGAYVCHPLIAGGELFGTLAFGSKNRTEHTQESVGLFRAVSDLVALAIARHRAEQSLRDADRRKDEFLATLAHELRNPLAPLRSGLDIMSLVPQDRESMEATRVVMERQVEQLTRLVDDLLEVSRITQGRLELRKSRVSLPDILESALDQTRTLFEQADHELSIDLPEEPIVLNGDKVRLSQVLANLLSNAAKYTPERGHISVEAERSSSGADITVRDDGIGIPPEKLEHIFEMFEQVDRSLEGGYKGLGLGLTLVKSLVELHGGAVEARSEGLGRGSEFTIHLPISALSEVVESSSSDANASSSGEVAAVAGSVHPRVLIVDDNVDAANMLVRLVQLLGYQTHVASDGLEALEAATAFRPDIVLLDIGLPKMNGYDVARRIREGPKGERTVLVALTGWGQTQDKHRAALAGFDHYLIKPVHRSALQPILDRAARDGP